MTSTDPPGVRAGARGAARGADDRRARLETTLTGRFWLRWHLALMLVAALSTGFLVSYALLHAPVQSIVLRWMIGLAAGYAMLFVGMRLWLAYVGVRPLGFGAADVIDGGNSGSSGGWFPGGASRGSSTGGFGGGGGTSGGAGASATFDAPEASGAVRASAAGGSAGGSHGGLGVDLGDAFSGDDGWLVIVLGAVVLAVVAALGGTMIYMVHEAPHLLADVAFGSALTSGMAGTARRVASLDWCGSVLRATWKPFAALAAVVIVAALVVEHYFPGARTLGEAWLLVRH